MSGRYCTNWERLTRLGNANVLRLPVSLLKYVCKHISTYILYFCFLILAFFFTLLNWLFARSWKLIFTRFIFLCYYIRYMFIGVFFVTVFVICSLGFSLLLYSLYVHWGFICYYIRYMFIGVFFVTIFVICSLGFLLTFILVCLTWECREYCNYRIVECM